MVQGTARRRRGRDGRRVHPARRPRHPRDGGSPQPQAVRQGHDLWRPRTARRNGRFQVRARRRLRRGRGGRWFGPARRRVGGGCTRAAADDGRCAGGDSRPGGGLHGLRRGGPGGFRVGRGGLRDRWLRHALDRGRQPARRHRSGSPTRRRRQVAVGGGADRMVVRGRPRVGSRQRDRGRRCSDRRPSQRHRPNHVRPAAPGDQGAGDVVGSIWRRGQAVPAARPRRPAERHALRAGPVLDVHAAPARRWAAQGRGVLCRFIDGHAAAGGRVRAGPLDRRRPPAAPGPADPAG